MQAACGSAQLELINNFVEICNADFSYLENKHQSYADFLHMSEDTLNSEPSWFGFLIILKENSGVKRIDLIN